MYDFFYQKLKEDPFEGRVFFMGMDTDSLILIVYTDSLYHKLGLLWTDFDFK